jgi:hypothetical protein
MIFKIFLRFILYLFYLLGNIFFALLLILLITIKPAKKSNLLLWGPVPILNNKYWSKALSIAGYNSKTLMSDYFNINHKEDFDLYYNDFSIKWIRPLIFNRMVTRFRVLLFILRNCSVLHFPFSGGPFGETPIWKIEAFLFKLANVKTVVIPYGADAYMYSQVVDISLRSGLLTSYPLAAKREGNIKKRIEFWTKHADVMLAGFMIDGRGRWDCNINQLGVIDLKDWHPKKEYSDNNGYNGVVKILHTPNHQGVKGTEFLVDAVEQLKSEGLKLELILLEKVPNSKVKELMQEVDILAEQFIYGYTLSAIEGLASGLTVLSNLENEDYTRVFRRYSFLNECPVLSTTPENVKHHIKILATNPELRKELGLAGRQYAEKYHSYEMGEYLFGSIYDKILHGKDIDLMNLFHPLKSEYNKRKPLVKHPLNESKLPGEYFIKNA